MRIVIQRVAHASVTIDDKTASQIGKGLLILIGIENTDCQEDADWLVKKVVGLRVFDDENGVMNRSILDVGGEILAVSQFTLLASTRKGNRPSYIKAARHELAVPMYEEFCRMTSTLTGRETRRGVFGADMKVSQINDGPVTIVIDSKNK